MEKILVINPFGIGDCLFTTPVVRAVKEALPDCLIGYWCNQRVGGLLKANKRIDRVFALSRGDLKKIYARSIAAGVRSSLGLFFAIRRGRFTISLDYSLDHRYGLAAKLAGIKKRIGFNYKKRGRFLTHKIDLNGYADKHAVEYYLELLKFINITPRSRNLELSFPPQEAEKAKTAFAGYGIKEGELVIGIAPGGGESWGRDAWRKHWPQENFAQLSDRLIDELAAKVLVLGGSDEKPIAQSLVGGMKNRVVDLTGRTDLPGLAAAIDNLDIVVANDGGILHMAAALGKKTVSFFGPVDPLVYGPYPADEKRHIVLDRRLECSPCYANFRLKPCLKNKVCLREIPVEEAFEAVVKLAGTERG